jgi:hypothetical protein
MIVGELKTLDRKLQNDGDRIQQDIAQYAELNHQITQMTAIVPVSMKTLPQITR